MHGSVIDVGGNCFLNNICDSSIGVVGRVTLSLLLVTDEVLRGGLHASILVATNGLFHGDTGQVRISSKAFPVSACVGRAAEWAGHRAEGDVSTLSLELLSHGVSSFIEEISVPRGCHGDTGSENTGIVGDPN